MTRSRTIAAIAASAVVVALIAIGVQFIAHGNSSRPDLGRSIVVDPSKVTPTAGHPSRTGQPDPSATDPSATDPSATDPARPGSPRPGSTTPTTPGATPVAPPSPSTGDDDDPDGVDLDDLDDTGSGTGADD